MTAAGMLAQMRKALGWGEPNAVHRWYSQRNGSYFGLGSTPWCQMTITWAAYKSGNYDAVCPNGDRAYTVWHAQDGQKLGRWYAGTVENLKRHAKPGAIVFFDWSGTNYVSAVDHVGIVEKVLSDGRVQTIEGNTDNACKRRVRSADVIAGFWNPAYKSEPKKSLKEDLDMDKDDVYKAVWEADKMPVSYGSKDNPKWKPLSVLVNHGEWLRKIDAKLDAQNAAIRALAEALADHHTDLDVDTLVSRVRSEIERVTISLDVA